MDRIISGMITMGCWCGVRIVGNVILTTAPLMNLVCSTLMMTGSALTVKGGMAMLERQKVIKGLTECVAAGLENACPPNCPYFLQCFPDAGLGTPFMPLMADALALLKEQEAEIRQLRLALDIAKGTCKGINVEGR